MKVIEPDPVSMIVGSTSKEKIKELTKLVEHRSVYAHSIGYYDIENHAMFGVNRGRVNINFNNLDPSESNWYYIVYLQLTSCDNNIQPASTFTDVTIREEFSDHWLWFNGSLKDVEIEKLQFEEDGNEKWEAMLLLKHVIRYEAPVDVDGSFSCLYSDGADLYLFRNEFEAMFFDQQLNICSVPFSGSMTTSANKMFKMDFKKKSLIQVDEFQTVRHWV